MSRNPFSGNKRQLLVAFDVGTTFSGISYSILDPGKQPQIYGVTRFPGQELAGTDAKIPSVIYYSRGGDVQAVGANAVRDGMDIIAEEEEWVRADWFKLHLPSSRKKDSPEIPPLAVEEIGKTAIDVFADFLTYLNDAAKEYIQERHPGVGLDVWESGEIHYILSHPNGWEGKQQSLLRQAAEKAGLVTREPDEHRKVTFITEGEASLNRCIEKGLVADAMISSGEGVVIVDAGGGTIDISAYACQPDGKTYEEIAESQCHVKGSIFVTQKQAKEYLEGHFAGTPYLDDIPQLLEAFDKSTKCIFRSAADPHFISLTSRQRKLRDPRLGIVAGRLRLDGAAVASFFEPSIQCIISSVLKQQKISHKKISNVFLVGGFSGSDYLFRQVREELEKHGLKVWRPDTQLNKVVADGAISGILDHPVRTRVSRVAYGVKCDNVFNPLDNQQVKRKDKCYTCQVSGDTKLPGMFSIILPRNTQVHETKEFRNSFLRDVQTNDWYLSNRTSVAVDCYQGCLPASDATWMDNDPANFCNVCQVEMDLTKLSKSISIGLSGPYYKFYFDVILKFGLTELEAQVAWKENGVERRGPAKIIYDTNRD